MSSSMMLGKFSRETMTSRTDEEDIKAALNLCSMKHLVLDSEKDIQILEDIKRKSLGRIRVFPNVETKQRTVQIEKQEAAIVNVAQGSPSKKQLKQGKEMHIEEQEAMKVAQGFPRKQQLQQGPKRKEVHIEEQEAMKVAQGLPAANPQQGLFYGNYAPPNLPPVPSLQQFIEICSEPFEKQLTSSDVKDGQLRLAMSKEDVQNRLMPLLNENEDLNDGIEVTTYDLAGKEYPMKFKTWVSKIHVLTGGWKVFCAMIMIWLSINILLRCGCFGISQPETFAS